MASIYIQYPSSNARSSGNFVSAKRWQGILEGLGHQVSIGDKPAINCHDILLGLNAARIGEQVRSYKACNPNTTLIYAITGTDIHGDTPNRSKAVNYLEDAKAIICINPLSKTYLPQNLQTRAKIILQSAELFNLEQRTIEKNSLLIVGHLREEKDPFLVCKALELLAEKSTLEAHHFGGALSPKFEAQANAYSKSPLAYTWHGEVDSKQVISEMLSAKALLITSKVEGAPAVLSEAIGCLLPVIASDIDGCRGLLGDDYPAYFPAGDVSKLCQLLSSLEKDPEWREGLQQHITKIQDQFALEKEISAFKELLSELEN